MGASLHPGSFLSSAPLICAIMVGTMIPNRNKDTVANVNK